MTDTSRKTILVMIVALSFALTACGPSPAEVKAEKAKAAEAKVTPVLTDDAKKASMKIDEGEDDEKGFEISALDDFTFSSPSFTYGIEFPVVTKDDRADGFQGKVSKDTFCLWVNDPATSTTAVYQHWARQSSIDKSGKKACVADPIEFLRGKGVAAKDVKRFSLPDPPEDPNYREYQINLNKRAKATVNATAKLASKLEKATSAPTWAEATKKYGPIVKGADYFPERTKYGATFTKRGFCLYVSVPTIARGMVYQSRDQEITTAPVKIKSCEPKKTR